VADEKNPGYVRDQVVLGPHRVFPGRLSVSRTFGDIEAKRPKYGGNPKVVIATPDITCFKVEDNYDFIILGCDGIFDKLSNQKVFKACWEASKKSFKNRATPIHGLCGLAVEAVLKASVADKTMDNITAVMISFKHFKKSLKYEVDELSQAL